MPKHPAMHETKFIVPCWHWTRAVPLKRDNIVHLRCPLVGLALYCTEKGGQLTSTARATLIIFVYISVHEGVPHPTSTGKQNNRTLVSFTKRPFITSWSSTLLVSPMFKDLPISRPIRCIFPRKMWPKFDLRLMRRGQVLFPNLNASSEKTHEDDFSGSDDDFLSFYDE